MSSQSRINAYMERHRLGALFEDLMNKVIRDMPEEPLVYLLRAMYKKAGMEIPQGIRYGGVRKSTSDLPRRSSPERQARSAAVSASVDAGGSRQYNRPWATSPTRRTKPKKVEEQSEGKKKPEWNPDSRVKSSPLDEFWEGAEGNRRDKHVTSSTQAGRRSGAAPQATAASSWAVVGMEDDGEQYTSPVRTITHTSQKSRPMTEEELLAMESIGPSLRSEPSDLSSTSVASLSGRYHNSRKMEARRHREELSQLLSEVDHRSDDSGLGTDDRQLFAGQEDADAIELLENADDLRQEGVTNIPRSGYRLSRNMRYRENEPRVKLNINVSGLPSSANSSPGPSHQQHRDPFDTPRSSPEQVISEEEDEFESVSQVTGPRQPVWNVGGPNTAPSGNQIPLRPSYSRTAPHKSSSQPRSAHPATPTRNVDRSVESTEELVAGAKTWTEGVSRVSFHETTPRPDSAMSDSSTSGWHIPDDTEIASAHDWNARVRGGPPRDPRAY